MDRPHRSLGVADLESMFMSSSDDAKTLRALEHELRNRQVPKARSLLTKVRAALRSLPSTGAQSRVEMQSLKTVCAQDVIGDFADLPDIVSPEATTSLEVSLDSSSDAGTQASATPSQESSTSSILAGSLADCPAMNISLVEAYRALGASPGDDWGTIEAKRRAIVERSSPARASGASREVLQQEADRVNSAYRLILESRMRGHL